MGKVICGDSLTVLKTLPSESVQCVVCSPPYWGMRDYGFTGQIGLEPTLAEYIEKLTAVFSEVRRILRKDGTLWLNIGDAYVHPSSGGGGPVDIRRDGRKTNPGDKVRGRLAGSNTLGNGLKPKDLLGLPWRLAFALQDAGWWLRSDIIWSKTNPIPESVRDRPTRSHEYVFLMAKARHYFYNAAAIMEKAITGDEARWDNGENGHGGGVSHAGRGSSTRKFRQPIVTGWKDGPGDHGNRNDQRKKGGPNSRVSADRASRSDKKDHPERNRSSASQRFGRFPGWRNPKVAEVAPPHKRTEWENLRSSPGAQYLQVVMRNKRTVWELAPEPYPDAHFATFPEALVIPCILAGSRPGDVVLDPFAGSGTTLAVAVKLGRDYIGIEAKKEYIELIEKRLSCTTQGMAI